MQKTFFIQKFKDGEIRKTIHNKYVFNQDGLVKGNFENISDLKRANEKKTIKVRSTSRAYKVKVR